MSQLKETRTAAWRAAISVLGAVEEWLRTGRPHGTVMVDHEGEAAPNNKGESVTDVIERLRRRCYELRADLNRIESAAFPSSHAKKKMREQIEALAARGQPNASSLIERDDEVLFATMPQKVQVLNQPGATAFFEPSDLLGLIAWLFKPTLIAALDCEIDAEADDRNALSHEERQKREAVVSSDLLEIERQEAALVWTAQSSRETSPAHGLGTSRPNAARLSIGRPMTEPNTPCARSV